MKNKENNIKVFLGGACNPTMWRFNIAIPILENEKISYYNPQVLNWSEELVEIERKAKESAEILLFVINEETRAVASMIELAEFSCSGRMVVAVIKDIPENAKINDDIINGNELKDLNRGRSYLRDVVKSGKHNFVFEDVLDAIKFIIKKEKKEVIEIGE